MLQCSMQCASFDGNDAVILGIAAANIHGNAVLRQCAGDIFTPFDEQDGVSVEVIIPADVVQRVFI